VPRVRAARHRRSTQAELRQILHEKLEAGAPPVNDAPPRQSGPMDQHPIAFA
jgi:plasmid stability protein